MVSHPIRTTFRPKGITANPGSFQTVTVIVNVPTNLMKRVVDELALGDQMKEFTDGVAEIYQTALNKGTDPEDWQSENPRRAFKISRDPKTGFPFIINQNSGLKSQVSSERAFKDYVTPIQSFRERATQTEPIAFEVMFRGEPRKYPIRRELKTPNFMFSAANDPDIAYFPTGVVHRLMEYVGGSWAAAYGMALSIVDRGTTRKPIISRVFNVKQIRSGDTAFFAAHSGAVRARIGSLINRLQSGRNKKAGFFPKTGGKGKFGPKLDRGTVASTKNLKGLSENDMMDLLFGKR